MNRPALVEELLAVPGFSGDESVELPGGAPTRPMPRCCRRSPCRFRDPDSSARWRRSPKLRPVSPCWNPHGRRELDAWLRGRDVAGLARACPGTGLSRRVRRTSPPLQPRLCTPSHPHPRPIRATSTLPWRSWEVRGPRTSAQRRVFRMARRSCGPGSSPVPVFVQTSHGFRLPKDPSVPVIMIDLNRHCAVPRLPWRKRTRHGRDRAQLVVLRRPAPQLRFPIPRN